MKEINRIAELEQENAELKAKKAKYYQQTLDGEIQINELLQTLQEIKNFLELPEFYLYGKETIHDRILQKITKAEVGE